MRKNRKCKYLSNNLTQLFVNENKLICNLNFQLKAAQLEWNYNLKALNEKISSAKELSVEDTSPEKSTRHQRLLRKRVIDIERLTKRLHKENGDIGSKLLRLEEEIKILQKYRQDRVTYDVIPGQKLEEYLERHDLTQLPQQNSNSIPEAPTMTELQDQLAKINRRQSLQALAIQNLTKQLSNSDKLHMSMLELLENVESIENKVDKNFPEFRKEISKLEVQMGEAASTSALLREEQTNTRESLKAMGVGVSNLQDKVAKQGGDIKLLNETLESLKKSSVVQTSKLHDHILKVRDTPSTMTICLSLFNLVCN